MDAAIAVEDAAPVTLIASKASKRCALDVVQHRVDLGARGRILRGPGDDAGRVAVFGSQRVDDLRGQPRVAAQDYDLGSFLAAVIVLKSA